MRKLVYDCYEGKKVVATVSTMKEAKEWENKFGFQSVKIRLEEATKEETEKERKERFERAKKINEAIKRKKRNAVVGS